MINRYTVIILAVVIVGLTLIINMTNTQSESVLPPVVWAQTAPPQAPATPSDSAPTSETAPALDIRNLMNTNAQLETYIRHYSK